jgi:hypothetical protein
MIRASEVVELFEGTAPGAGNDLHVGGYENDIDSSRTVYFPGGYGSVASLASSVREAGPTGFLLSGGGRHRPSRKVKKSRKARKSRKVKKSKKAKKSRKHRRVRFSRRLLHFSQ